MGYNIIYCDTEAAVDEKFVTKFGIDPEKFRYQPINTPREFTFFITNLLETIRAAKKKKIQVPKIMLVLDSIGNMATEKLKADAVSGSGKKDMTKQQELKALFAVVTMELAQYKIPFIITSHTYDAVGSFFPSTVVSGGSGGKYNTSVILKFHPAQLKDANAKASRVGMKKSGIVVRSVPDKNRFARPITIRFHISFYQGMNPFVGLEDYINWESAGIAKGKLHGKTVWNKMSEEEKQNALDSGTAWYDDDDNIHIFEARSTARNFVVKHLNSTIKPGELFTSRVITDEILHHLDDTIIKDLFALPEIGDVNLEDGFDDLALSTNSEDMTVDELLEGVLEKEDED
jgi:hypothetical protein